MWITKVFFKKTNKAPTQQALKSVLNTMEAQAWTSKRQATLQVRAARHEGAIFYDLCDDKGRVVKISSDGWEVLDNPPILFRRYSHMQAQPVPDKSGNIDHLLEFINLKKRSQKILYLAGIVADFIPDIPRPIKVFYGEEGSTKTTSSRVTRQIVDPSAIHSSRSYRNEREMIQYTAHNYSCLLDNLSGINPRLSDFLCSAVTGDGDSKRALFTNDDDVIVRYKRGFIINGINNVVIRPDLLRRSILFKLERPEPGKRKEESLFWQEFEDARPLILGGIFNTLSKAMEIYPETNLEELHDMADFTRWGAAITEALGYNSSLFLKAYNYNKAQQAEEALPSSSVALALKAFMKDKQDWSGTATDLLLNLEKAAREDNISIKDRDWPKAPNSLSRKMSEFKATLRRCGIDISDTRDASIKRTRLIKIKVLKETGQIVH